jgi:rubrerythrin
MNYSRPALTTMFVALTLASPSAGRCADDVPRDGQASPEELAARDLLPLVRRTLAAMWECYVATSGAMEARASGQPARAGRLLVEAVGHIRECTQILRRVEGALEARDQRIRAGIVWTCPMHPHVVTDGPEPCPICHMPTVKMLSELRNRQGKP